jgi:hypothetical protein
MIAAPLLIIGGTILLIAAIQSAYPQLALTYWAVYEMYIKPGIMPGLELATINSAISGPQNNINLWYGLLVGFIIYAGLCFPAAIGLLYMKNWGRYLALVVSIASIVAGVITILWLVGLIPLGFGIGMLVYLLGDVKHEFV